MSKMIGLSAGGKSSGLSGVHKYLYESFENKIDLEEVINTRLSGFWKYYNYIYCSCKLLVHKNNPFSMKNIDLYRMHTKYYMNKRTKKSIDQINKINYDYDVIFQTSSIPFITNKPNKIYCLFIDFTMRLAEEEYPLWAKFLSIDERNMWIGLESATYNNASVVFTASENTRKSVINDYGVLPNNVVTVYEGLNLSNFPKIKNEYNNKIILFTGVDFERKGGDVLISAFLQVKKKIKNAKLIIAGSNPQIDIPGVLVKGFVTEQELHNLYNSASIFVMPSLCEPFGLVFLEAMAYGLPCIGTTNDAMPEIIDEGVTGFIVPPNDYLRLAEKIVLLLENEPLMQQMGINGRKRVEDKFTWDLVTERILNQIKLIMD